MKKTVLLLFVLCSLSLLIGCGSDGEDGADGKAFISINWLYDPLYYADDNPGVPTVGTNGTYYQSSPGTYYFSYEAWDASIWSGLLSLQLNQPKKPQISQNKPTQRISNSY